MVTIPVAAVLVATGDAQTGAAVIVVRLALYVAIAMLAWRLPGERADALRDVLMHPRVRAFLRAERDVILTLPLLAGRTLRARRSPRAFRYSRRGHQPAVALAFTPVVIAEAVPLYLLLPGEWVLAHAVSAAVHAYALLWLWAWALGPRAWPHSVRGDALLVRNGPFYRACVPLAAIDERRRFGVAERRAAAFAGELDRAVATVGGGARERRRWALTMAPLLAVDELSRS